MDNSSGGGSPASPPLPSAAGSEHDEQQFTVPIPTYSTPTQSIPLPIPRFGIGPWSAGSTAPAQPSTETPAAPYAVSSLPAQGPSDAESLRTMSLVLLGVVIGFWVFVGIRILTHLVDVGASDRLLIETIDQSSVETVAAAIIAVLTVAAAGASQVLAGRRLNTPLVWGTGVLAIITIITAVWRVV